MERLTKEEIELRAELEELQKGIEDTEGALLRGQCDRYIDQVAARSHDHIAEPAPHGASLADGSVMPVPVLNRVVSQEEDAEEKLLEEDVASRFLSHESGEWTPNTIQACPVFWLNANQDGMHLSFVDALSGESSQRSSAETPMAAAMARGGVTDPNLSMVLDSVTGVLSDEAAVEDSVAALLPTAVDGVQQPQEIRPRQPLPALPPRRQLSENCAPDNSDEASVRASPEVDKPLPPYDAQRHDIPAQWDPQTFETIAAASEEPATVKATLPA